MKSSAAILISMAILYPNEELSGYPDLNGYPVSLEKIVHKIAQI
jgi:hypothetical protein